MHKKYHSAKFSACLPHKISSGITLGNLAAKVMQIDIINRVTSDGATLQVTKYSAIQYICLFVLVLIKRHRKFVVSLPLNAAQGSHTAEPVGRG